MRNVNIFFAVFVFIPLSVAYPANARSGNEGVMRFKATAEIMTHIYVLEDIVDLEGLAPQRKVHLANVEIGKTPRPGQWTQVTQTQVFAALVQRLPGLARGLRWEGPAFIRIRGGGVRCDMDALKQSAYRYLLDRLRRQYDQVAIQIAGEPRPVITTVGRVTFHPKVPQVRHVNKRIPVWVDILVEGRHFQTVPLWFDVSVHLPVWVAQKDLAPKEPMATDSVIQRLENISGLGGEPLKASSVAGLRAVHKLAAGMIITAEDVEPIPAVSQGDLITVYAVHGKVRLQVKAVALADGRVSDRIEVQNPGSGESFRATVIGTKQAMVN